MIPFRYHRTTIRWLHDDIARASRSRVACVRQLSSFFFPSHCLRESKNARYHRYNDYVTIWQDAITMTLQRAKWIHEVNTKMSLRKNFCHFFLHAKDFAFAHEVGAEAWKIQPAIPRWVKMASRMTRCCHDQTRIWTIIFVCPSAFKFGTVWRQHKGNRTNYFLCFVSNGERTKILLITLFTKNDVWLLEKF